MQEKIHRLTDTERQFLKSRENDLKTIAVGYLTGVSADRIIFKQYEALYRRMDPTFHGDAGCDNCVYNMVKRVWNWFEDQMKEPTNTPPTDETAILRTPAVVEEPAKESNEAKQTANKKGRKKVSGSN